jgi:hypothetical protein
VRALQGEVVPPRGGGMGGMRSIQRRMSRGAESDRIFRLGGALREGRKPATRDEFLRQGNRGGLVP